MDERVKKVVVEETQHIKAVSAEAVRSRAYIYPVQVFHKVHTHAAGFSDSCRASSTSSRTKTYGDH